MAKQNRIHDIIGNLKSQPHDDVQREFTEHINQLTPQEVREQSEQLTRAAGEFVGDKRYNELLEIIEARKQQPLEAPPDTTNLRHTLKEELTRLKKHRIFEWATDYKDLIRRQFDDFSPDPASRLSIAITDMLRDEVSIHTKEIFGMGYAHKTGKQNASDADAHKIGLSGLERFLQLAYGEYQLRIRQCTTTDDGKRARLTCSALISGILVGFCRASLGDISGMQLMFTERQWDGPKYIILLTKRDHEYLNSALDTSDDGRALCRYSFPLVEAMEEMFSTRDDVLLLVQDVIWKHTHYRVEVVYTPQTADGDRGHDVNLWCYLRPESSVLPTNLDDIDLLLLSLRAKDRPKLHQKDFKDKVIDTSDDGAVSGSQTSKYVIDGFDRLMPTYAGKEALHLPIRANHAARFPLKVTLPDSLFVDRPSVWQRIRVEDGQCGVKVWTGPRRAGKTTACAHLVQRDRTSTFVFQTCRLSSNEESDRFFFQDVSDILHDPARRLEKDFFKGNLERYAGNEIQPQSRVVFVLDEYETLFQHLANSGDYHSVETRVAHPLLDQLALFSQDNLLIFVGQQPDELGIFMTSNQLVTRATHEPFPMFGHAPGDLNSETSKFIKTVLQDRIPFEATFADAVHEETSGHPWLTVNLLVDLNEWLIHNKRPLADLKLTSGDLAQYVMDRLEDEEHLLASDEFDFFRKQVNDYRAIQKINPWLFAVHDLLFTLADETGRFEWSREEYKEMFRSRGLANLNRRLGPSQLLKQAVSGGFFATNESNDTIAPAIRLFARIARAVVRDQ